MSVQNIQILYCIVFFAYVITEIGLIKLNIKSIHENSSEVPSIFKEFIDQETYKKSVSYSITRSSFSIIATVYSSALTLAFLFLGWFAAIDQYIASLGFSQLTSGVGFVIISSFAISFLSLPLSLYSTFVIEERFGFNKMTWKMWLSDTIKETLIGLLFSVLVLYILLWFMKATGAFWWVYAFGFIIIFQIFMLYIYPAWISPIFNKFEPLSDQDLSQMLIDLASRIKFKLAGVYQMDGSKRSSHANAYFTGFGKNKRIVLFDTLLSTLDKNETLSVIAHEMGHQKLNHIKKMIAVSFLSMLIGFWFLSLLVNYPPFFQAFSFSEPSNHAALLLFAVASAPFTYFLSPLFSSLSRKHEYEADKFAFEATGESRSLINGLLKLAKKSLSNLTPHPLYSFFHYSHPTLHERIARLSSLG